MTDQPPPSGENHADLPIEQPAQDLCGIDPFVRSLARSVRGMNSPQGIVIGLNGPWGPETRRRRSTLGHLRTKGAAGGCNRLKFLPRFTGDISAERRVSVLRTRFVELSGPAMRVRRQLMFF